MGQLQIKNITAEIIQFKNFWERERYTCNIDVTLDTLTQYRFWTSKADQEPFANSILNEYDRNKLRMRLMIES